MRNGHINWTAHDRDDTDYEVRWLSGDEQKDAWSRYGIVESVGTYMARAFRK